MSEEPHTASIRWAAVALVALASCCACSSVDASVRACYELQCPTADWAFYDETVDGQRRCLPCQRPWGLFLAPGEPTPRQSTPLALEFVFLEAPASPPFCGPFLRAVSRPLVSGQSGGFEPFRGYYFGFEPKTFLTVDYVPSGVCARRTEYTVLSPTRGTWFVREGGSFGDRVDVEVRDLEFPPQNGHSIYIHLARWHMRLPSPPGYYGDALPAIYTDAVGEGGGADVPDRESATSDAALSDAASMDAGGEF